MVRWKDTRWGVVAVIASASLHVAFAALVVARPTSTSIEREPVEVEAIFTEVPRTDLAKEAPPKPPAEPEPPEPKPTRVAAVPPPPRRPRVPVEPPVTDRPSPDRPSPDSPISDRPLSDVPTADRPTPAEAPTAQRVDLGLRADSTVVIRLDAGVPGRDVEVVTGRLQALEAPKAKDLVANLTKETLGKGRVDRGLVHPYYAQLGKALLKNWDADRVAKANGLSGFLEQGQANFKQYNEIWLERAAQYGSSGNPMDSAPAAGRRAPTNERIQGLTGVDLEQRKEMSKAMREEFRATRRAIIRVVQTTEGRLTKVELVQPSNDQQVDQEALADVKTAAEKLPPPPSEATEGKETLSSLWSFELIISISPPVPSFSFEFDEALGFIDARLPLDRRIYKKVRLVSVE